MVQLEAPRQKPDGLKHYSTDPMKEKVHELLGQMLDDTLLRFRKPSDIHVLHFAGIDAAETRRVYLGHSIPAGNITTLERDPAVADEIERLGLGINVIRSSFEDYVMGIATSGNKPRYDVISLDFTGPLTQRLIDSISTLMDLCQGNHTVFHSANLLRREQDGISIFADSIAMKGSAQDNIDNPDLAVNGYVNTVKSYIDSYLSDKTDAKKSNYPMLMMRYLICNDSQMTAGWLSVIEFIHANSPPDIRERAIGFVNGAASRELSGLSEVALDLYSFQNISIGRVGELLRDYPEFSNYQTSILRALLLSKGIAFDYHIKKASAYWYVSESGSPMIGSVFYSIKPRYLIDAAKEVAYACGFPSRFRISDPQRLRKALYNMLKLEGKEHDSGVVDPDSIETTFLGNASKPVLNKSRFLALLDEGRSIDEIRATYRGWSNMPLPQWKAHHTMGTYGRQSDDVAAATPAIVEAPKDTDIDKITKEEAYELLQAGIPAAEIHANYPSSFTMGQLSAFRAWLTMREAKRE